VLLVWYAFRNGEAAEFRIWQLAVLLRNLEVSGLSFRLNIGNPGSNCDSFLQPLKINCEIIVYNDSLPLPLTFFTQLSFYSKSHNKHN
jgi:hypothetical protein